MTVVVPRGLPAAAGYPQYSGTPFIPPKISADLMTQYYCEAIIPAISTTRYIGELKSGGDQLTFYRVPSLPLQPYVKDGTIQHDTLELEPVTIGIKKGFSRSIKIDRVDEMASPIFSKVLAAANDVTVKALRQAVDAECFGYMATTVHPANQGANAGVDSGVYDLGETGAPVALNKTNILEVFTHVAAVLDEQCVPQEDRWLILPPQARPVLINSNLADASFMGGGGRTILLNGKAPETIAGFNVFYSQQLPRVYDTSAGTMAYSILAGRKEAFAFAIMHQESRIIDNDKDSWSKYYQNLFIYGYDTIRPESMAHLYAYFE